MISIITPEEMRAVDAAATEPVDVLIARAGGAVARAARRLLGGTYGRRVVVVAGKGNNGNDGRVAAERLERAGAQVRVVEATAGATRLPPADLVIDAAYGTGFRGTWQPPDPGSAPVLAVDIPSGVDGLTGAAEGPVLAASATVTFAALKPGLVLEPGRSLAGAVDVADIGLPAASSAHLLTESDVRRAWPARPVTAHKWRAATWVVAGSPGMLGAAHLASRAAQRAGAGMVWLSSPGVGVDPQQPTEVVGRAVAAGAWAPSVLGELGRFHSVVVGPGLGRADTTASAVRELVAGAGCPLVVDGDGLAALSGHLDVIAGRAGRGGLTVLTPHDGEYTALWGSPPGPDRIAAARALAARSGAVVLLKGPTTVVASAGGDVLVVTEGDARLATAGTGDVLSGIIGALLAQRVDPLLAAAVGAWVHGAAARLGPAHGLVAGDLVELLPAVLAPG